MKDILLGLFRHVLGAAGAVLATNGVIEATQVETIVGSVMALVAVVLSVIDKKKAK